MSIVPWFQPLCCPTRLPLDPGVPESPGSPIGP